MTTRVDLTMREDNDEIVDISLTAVGSANLATVTSLSMIIKPSECDGDTGDGVLTLSSTTPAQITINTQTPTEITATAFVPRAYLAAPYERVWRLDLVTSTARHTALYGTVHVIDL